MNTFRPYYVYYKTGIRPTIHTSNLYGIDLGPGGFGYNARIQEDNHIASELQVWERHPGDPPSSLKVNTFRCQ